MGPEGGIDQDRGYGIEKQVREDMVANMAPGR
jgi:hypothetical protein